LCLGVLQELAADMGIKSADIIAIGQAAAVDRELTIVGGVGCPVQGKVHHDGLDLQTPIGSKRLRMLGEHNLTNATLAWHLAVAVGVEPAAALTGLAAVAPVAGRLQPELLGQHAVLNDAYNANPASLLAGLQTLARQPGRRLAVVGTMAELGREARQWHRALGIAAARLGVALVAVGEFADDYLTGYHLQGGGEGDGCATLDEAVAMICERLAIGPTCLLVKGSRSAGLEVLLDDVRTALEDASC
jgi:UDP-N-acetylmuramoyl-tripeptide--D-alanyl-D-alanine ligase